MNKDNCCSDYVCTCSGCKQACKRHDIGAQCGATVANKTAKFITDIEIIANQQNQQKPLKQLEVVPNPVDVEPDPYKGHPAAFVPSKAPKRRIPPFMNIRIQEHHITPICKR